MILLKDCLRLVRLEDEDLSGVDVLLEGNRITQIAKNISIPCGARVIDASHLVVAPGLVNTHHHFYQTLTRNLPAVQTALHFSLKLHQISVCAFSPHEALCPDRRRMVGFLLIQ